MSRKPNLAATAAARSAQSCRDVACRILVTLCRASAVSTALRLKPTSVAMALIEWCRSVPVVEIVEDGPETERADHW